MKFGKKCPVDTELQSFPRPIDTTKKLERITFFPLLLLPTISDLHSTDFWYRIKLNQRSSEITSFVDGTDALSTTLHEKDFTPL